MEDNKGRNFVAHSSREKADGSYADFALQLCSEVYANLTGANIAEYRDKDEKQEQEQDQAKEASQEATQTEAENEAKSAPKRGKSR